MGRAPAKTRDFLRETWMSGGEDQRRFRISSALHPAVSAVVSAIGGCFAYVHVKDHIVTSLSEKLVAIQESQEAAFVCGSTTSAKT